MTTPSVRHPAPFPSPSTGDAALDAAIAGAYAAADQGDHPNTTSLSGRGVALASCLTAALFDSGEVVWDDAAVDALAPAARAALKKAADLQYRQEGARRLLRNVILRDLAASPEGRAALRSAIDVAHGRTRGELLGTLYEGASREDLQAIARAIPEDAEHPAGILGALARLALDPRWGERLFEDTSASQSVLACALIALARTTPPQSALDRRWVGVALRVLGHAGFAQFGRAVLERFPADATLLAELLRLPTRVADDAQLLARHDTPEVLERLAAFTLGSSLADRPIQEALEKSAHAQAAHAAFAIVAGLEAQHAPSGRVKRYKALAKDLGQRFGVKPPKKAKATAASAAPAPELAPAPPPARPSLPPFAELEAMVAKAFAGAGLSARLGDLVSPAAAILTERVELATLSIGASRLGGPPDLPEGTPWPAVRKVPMTFVGQLDLAEVAKLPGPAWGKLLPARGLLSFFVHDSDPENYARKGAVIFTEAGAPLVRREVPATLATARRAPPASCRVELVPTLRLLHPSHRTVTHAMPHDLAEAYRALRPTIDLPLVSTLLGHRDRYDGEVKRGYRLLLQVTSDLQAGFEWGDDDELAFFIADKALTAGDFGAVDVRVGD